MSPLYEMAQAGDRHHEDRVGGTLTATAVARRLRGEPFDTDVSEMRA